jgi:lipopolysaccharide/colanic/teichoic acid biosynthesis glycosyltransferase
MQSSQQKVGVARKSRTFANDGHRAVPSLGGIPARREDVLEEVNFRAMLSIERRRAERSRQPFVLMLLDVTAVVTDREHPLLGQLTPVVSSAIRESDLIGWYRNGAVLAVIFTEVSEDGCVITEVLRAKMQLALKENFGQSLASRLAITFHVFPETWNGNSPDPVVDAKLYPEVSEKASSERFPRTIKRVLDIVGGAILLGIHSPVLACVALAIKLTSKGPVIYRQERLGQFGKSFQCLKFRTMYVDNDPKIHRDYVEGFIAGKLAVENGSAEAGTMVYKIKADPRVTPVGRFLRRMSLDEFPQFWNVLRGEMSLVGPRPPLPYEFQAYHFWHRRRVLDVKPGVTGLWQVTGRSRTSFDDMVRMDLRYCQRWSLWLDLKILLATPLAVFKGNGAF